MAARVRSFQKEKKALLEALGSYHKNWNPALVEKAFDLAERIHRHQKRQTGEPYFTHPLAVAQLLTEIKADYIAVSAGLLHDVVEDSKITIEELEQDFGHQIKTLVDGVTKIGELPLRDVEASRMETVRKLIITMARDIRVILIKLADRLHNMRTLSALPPSSQRRIAQETWDIYAPLAHRLGMARFARELEDLALQVLDPEGYHQIAHRLAGSEEERTELLHRFIQTIKGELDRARITALIEGRVKSIPSIYNKIHRQGKRLEEILDLLAVRIIVNERTECYRVLEIVHRLFSPVTEHFADYIALPKSNLYQSIHTKVRDQEGHILEVQIRTHDMHAIAEYGIAAHWLYKMGQVKPEAIDQKFSWIRSLLEWHREVSGGGEFVESLKLDLLQDEIFVFTPKGDLIKLPRGATVLDFAFAIHSDLGLKAIGAKMDGKVVPLSEEVTPGAVVEILTSSTHNPSAEWLKFVRTTRARNRIRRWFRETRFEEAAKLGKELLEAELTRMGFAVSDHQVKEVALSYGFNEVKDFYYNLGMGIISVGQAIRKLVPLMGRSQKEFAGMVAERVERKEGVFLKAIDNLVVTLAECCSPIPGDPIIAFQVPEFGLVVHRTDCRQIDQALGEDRKVVSVAWDVELEDKFKARLRIIADDRPNLLRDITLVISSLKMNITRVEFHMEEKLAIGTMEIEVHNLAHLTKLMGRLNRVRGILRVERQAPTLPVSAFQTPAPVLH